MIYFIYRIVVGDMTYIGSTTDIEFRWKWHRNTVLYKMRDFHFKIYQAMHNHGVDNCVFEIIRTKDCNNKTEARMEEQIEIDLIPTELSLNMRRAYTTLEQRKEQMRISALRPRCKELKKLQERKPSVIEYRKRYKQTESYKATQREYRRRPEVKERIRLQKLAKKQLISVQ